MRKTVLIAGNFDFPKGNAAGKRVLGLGYILNSLGYDVVYVGCKRERKSNNILDTRKKYENFIYYSFNGSRNVQDICNVSSTFSDFIEVVNSVRIQNVKMIVLYGSPVLALWIRKVIHFCHKSRIPVVFDCVDWIEKSGFDSLIKNIIKLIDTNYMKRWLACRCDGVITISRYLYEYYKNRECKTVLIPPVGITEFEYKDDRVIRDKTGEENAISIVYAGSMPTGHGVNRLKMKDRIDLSIEIMEKLNEKNIDFVFDIFGIEETQYKTAIPEHVAIIDGLSSKIIFHGQTNNDVVCQYIKEADFTILNRIVTKVTTAGFPSKVSESFLLGTPVITNATSNVDEYVINGENGMIIDFNTDAAACQIEKLVREKGNIKFMKESCKKNCKFDYHNFEKSLEDFIEEL